VQAGRVLLAVSALAIAGAAVAGALVKRLGSDGPEGSTGPTPRLLSQTGLYDLRTGAVRAENLEYAPQFPLWTDGAAKRRWIRLPPGTFVDASRPDAWVFPVGTRLWKEFAFGRRVETRTMVRTREGWTYATYVWNADGSDAVLAPERGIRGVVDVGAGGARHDIPGLADCRACHEGRAGAVLGFDGVQLGPEIAALERRGVIRGLPRSVTDEPPRIPGRTDRERAVLGYLYGNCAHCHHAGGTLDNVGLSFDIDLGALDATSQPVFATAVGREGHFRIGAGVAIAGAGPGSARRIDPGSPATSAVYVRMTSRDPLVQMPPLGTHVVDARIAELIEGWIREDLRPGGGARP
jgi:hypothetical protein